MVQPRTATIDPDILAASRHEFELSAMFTRRAQRAIREANRHARRGAELLEPFGITIKVVADDDTTDPDNSG